MKPRKFSDYKSHRQNNTKTEPITTKKTGVIELKGTIEEVLPNAQYRVVLESGQEILAHLSGKMRLHHIKVLLGDVVTVQMTPYDLTKGRIVHREK